MDKIAEIVATIQARVDARIQKEHEADRRVELLQGLSDEIESRFERGLTLLRMRGSHKGTPFCDFQARAKLFNLSVQGVQRFVQLRVLEVVLGDDRFVFEPELREDGLAFEYLVDHCKDLRVLCEVSPRRIALLVSDSARALEPANVIDIMKMLLQRKV